MSEVATYLKVGTTAIVLAMIEDDELGDDWLLGNPVAGDPPGQPRPDAAAHDHPPRRPPGHRARGAVGTARAGPQVRAHPRLRAGGRGDRRRRARQVGARARRARSATRSASPTGSTGSPSNASSTAIAERHGLAPAIGQAQGDRPAVPRPAAGALPGRSRSGWRRWSPHDDAMSAMAEPPTTTRAYFRGRCLQKCPERGRRRQLGLARVRRRPGSAAQGADDGTIAWHGRARR